MATEPRTESNQSLYLKPLSNQDFQYQTSMQNKQKKKKETAEGNPTAHHLPYRIQLTRL